MQPVRLRLGTPDQARTQRSSTDRDSDQLQVAVLQGREKNFHVPRPAHLDVGTGEVPVSAAVGAPVPPRVFLLGAVGFGIVSYVGSRLASRVMPAQTHVGASIEGSFTEGKG